MDYNDREFPNTSHIWDLVRCSVSFSTPSHLLKALEKFRETLEKNKNSRYLKDKPIFVSIHRIKNSFSDLKHDNNNVSYADVKINVKFNAPHFSHVVCEIQFALGMCFYAF